jgi:hypothetical protein
MEDRSVATEGEVFRLVREARRSRRFDWGVRVSAPSSAVAVPHLNEVRHLAHAINPAPTFAVNDLVSTGLNATALYRLEVVAPGLTLAPEGTEADAPAEPSAPAAGVDRTAEAGPARAGLPNQPQYGYWNSVEEWRDLSRWSEPRSATEEAEEARQEQAAQPHLDALDAARLPMG